MANFAGFRMVQTIIILSIIFVIYRNFNPIGLKDLTKGFLRGVLWSSGFGVVVLILGSILYFLNYNPFSLFRVRLPSSGLQLALYFSAICIIAPVYEEIVFRGVIYRLLRKRGVVIAVIVSSTIFSLMHMINGDISIVNIIGGFIFAISFEVEKNLVTPMTIHFAGNASIFLLVYLSS
jgi:membrane protease YdiL (CAAX protease family)